MNKLKWNAGQIVNDTNEYELAQYPVTDKPKYLVDYDFKDMEIARLNKIIDELEKWLEDTYNHFMYDNCEETLHNKPEEMEKYGFIYDLGSIHDKANIIEIIRKKLKELKEEGNKDE